MTKDRNALRAGMFILISIVLVAAIILGIKGSAAFVEPMREYTVVFSLRDNVGGLRMGDEVRIGGYKVGSISRIDVADIGTPQPHIRISFKMPRKYTPSKDARVLVDGTLTGTSWLNFENLGAGQALGAGETLQGRASVMSQVLASAAEITPRVIGVLDDVRGQTIPAVNTTVGKFGQTADSTTKLVEQVRGHVDPVAAKVHSMADRGSEMMVQVRDLIGDTKTDFRGTVANLNSATGSIKTKLPGMLERVDGILAKLDTTIQDVVTMMADVKATMANARDISASARNVMTGNKSKLDGMIASLKATSDNLKYASSEIRRSPWRLLYKPAAGEMTNLNLFDSAREFAEGANDLHDAASALRDAMQNPNVDKAEVQKLMERVEKCFGNFGDVEKKLWKDVKE